MSQTELAPSNRLDISDEGLRKQTLHRRFDRIARLVGDRAMQKLFASRVVIVGLGGVGSFAAESLARSGVGNLTLVDFDDICVTNTNRQLHAMAGRIGEKKAAVVAERLAKVNPQAKIRCLDKFYSVESADEILGDKPDLVLDCIDNLTSKCHLLATCRARGIPVITSGGASAKEDPLKIKFSDLADTHTDPFIHEVRRILRQKHGFPSEGPMGIPAVFSDERPSTPFELEYDKGTGFRCVCPQGLNNQHSCEKRPVIYGTASYVTGAFGLVMASRAVSLLKA
jgi:tRNA A37 threonylcarbamoyladenosine dehydratase